MYRRKKREAWRNWLDQHLQRKIAGSQEAQGIDLFKVLLNKPLPGLKDADGEWKRSRSDLAIAAIAWQKQFGDIENAEEVYFEKLIA